MTCRLNETIVRVFLSFADHTEDMTTARVTRSSVVYLVLPLLAFLALVLTWNQKPPLPVLVVLGLLLAGAVFSAVQHAEIVAHRVGEPYGSLILAVAVTIIEVGMIVTLMIASPETTTTLARDTVFSALMIILNGIVGISLIIKALRRGTAVFKPEGVGEALGAIAAMATLSLILPTFTTSTSGPTFNATQLLYAAATSLTLYLVFVFVQTVRHRDFFLPPVTAAQPVIDESEHSAPPSTRQALWSLALLLVALVSVVGLAKTTSPLLEAGITDAGLPVTLVAVSIAGLVLLPESIAAFRAAFFGRSQTSLNLAYGSAMASIGLTIPVIAVLSLVFGFSITLGLSTVEIVLFLISIIVSVLTIVHGRATILQGTVHLSILAGYVVFVINP